MNDPYANGNKYVKSDSDDTFAQFEKKAYETYWKVDELGSSGRTLTHEVDGKIEVVDADRIMDLLFGTSDTGKCEMPVQRALDAVGDIVMHELGIELEDLRLACEFVREFGA